MSRSAPRAGRLMLLLQERSECPYPPQIRRNRRPAVGAEASCGPGAIGPRGAGVGSRRPCLVARWDVPLRPGSGEDGRSGDRVGGLHVTMAGGGNHVGRMQPGAGIEDCTVRRTGPPHAIQETKSREAAQRHTDGRQDAAGAHVNHRRGISGATRSGDRQQRDERRPWRRERPPGASRLPVRGRDHCRRRGGTAPARPRLTPTHGVSGGRPGSGGTTLARPGFHERPLRQHSARGAA